jgi:G6PDH family F420-dependent oxidoreductase
MIVQARLPGRGGGTLPGMRFGYKLFAENFGPQELIRQAERAEAAGFDFVEISDHYHPWLDVQGHSPFAWTVLGAIAARTREIGLVTGVTCPTVRYHPAIIAQAAATLQIVSDNRFTLGVGAGERLNEHVVGQGFPAVKQRHERLVEALDIINLLWQGGYQSYEGRHLQLEDARVFDLPETLPLIAVAAGGNNAAELAATHGGGLFTTEPRTDLVETYRKAGGDGPHYAEVPMAWAPTEDAAVESALELVPWAVTGWKVMSELPNPVNFEAASSTVKAGDIREQFVVGPDVSKYVERVKEYADAGYDHLVLQNAGPDPDGFIDFYANELSDALKKEV